MAAATTSTTISSSASEKILNKLKLLIKQEAIDASKFSMLRHQQSQYEAELVAEHQHLESDVSMQFAKLADAEKQLESLRTTLLQLERMHATHAGQ